MVGTSRPLPHRSGIPRPRSVLHKPVAALLFALIFAFGAGPTATASAARSDVKIVIIVGPVEGSTKSYRAKANVAYDEAIKYTSDVTRIYSPNATWSRVKAATAGASIVIYLGHGNGWPSPYRFDPEYRTKDGFGLNRKAGAGNRNVKYYGEPYVARLDLAPNALIILNHLCYASGNSEPGYGQLSRKVARKRIDNFGAGFLAGSASAVLAEGHGSVVPYIRALFTTETTIRELWADGPTANGHVASFASMRTPGAMAYMDPNRRRRGFYRSLVVQPGLTTADVLAGAG